jgi:hypothetical protein
MKSLHVRAHVDAHGTLTLTMPPEMAGQDVELVVVFERVTPTRTAAWSTEATGWPPGFFEQTAGAWQGEPLTREPQGAYQERDHLWGRRTKDEPAGF